MLTFDVEYVDVRSMLSRGVSVKDIAVTMNRMAAHSQPKAWAGNTQIGTCGTDWVLMNSAVNNPEMAFTFTRTESVMRVPLIPYHTLKMALSDLVGFSVQIGMSAMLGLSKLTKESPKLIRLVLSNDCMDPSPTPSMFLFYVGIAIHTE